MRKKRPSDETRHGHGPGGGVQVLDAYAGEGARDVVVLGLHGGATHSPDDDLRPGWLPERR
eukprot:COSAG01_NODE_2474_length_7623_cov_9.861111_2_plen_61_part_00